MSYPNLSEEATAIWDANAIYWDDGMGRDGNDYWNVLQVPTLERLIPIKPDSEALELASGSGLATRWLVGRGASVLATDGSPRMLEYSAGYNNAEEAAKISYQLLDVTSTEAFDALLAHARAANGFDTVLMNMALMDIATLEPLAAVLPKLLKKDGLFVATMLHPVFFTCGATRSIEMTYHPETGEPKVVRSKIIRQYLDVPPYRGICMPGQPTSQIYFHRPLHEIFSVFFKAGLVMDSLEEPAFKPEHGISRIESHRNYTDHPALLAFRLRRAQW